MRDDCPYSTTPYLDPDATRDPPSPQIEADVAAGGQAACPVCGALYREGERPICKDAAGDPTG